MRKRRTRKKERAVFHTSNVIFTILCIITIGLLIATCLNIYFVNKQIERNIRDINKLVLQISSVSDVSTEETLEDIYLSYYNNIDQKAADSINIALSFFGFIFSMVTIVNTIVAIRIPKHFEENILDIDEKIKIVERNVCESTNAVHYIDSLLSKKTIREKIDAITDIIEDYGDNSGEFYFARGFLYDDLKDYESAKADYTRARNAGGAEHVYHNSMGVLYSNIMTNAKSIIEKKCALKKSEKHYKKAIMILENMDKKSDYCHCNLACLYQDYAKALKGWAIMEKINAKRISEVEYMNEFQKYSELALDEFEQTIIINDDFLTAFFNRGISYQEMGENFYPNAYKDFLRCYEIDPDNEEVLEELFGVALTLFQKTNVKEYYDVAKTCIKKLREDRDRLELLSERFNVFETRTEVIDNFASKKILAEMEEKIAELLLEEAEEYIGEPIEYGNRISDGLNHYNLALEMYKQLYSSSQDNEYWNAIERLKNKIAHIEKTD